MISIKYEDYASRLPEIRELLREIVSLRKKKAYKEADSIRDFLLSLDSGMKITQDIKGKVTLWHWPDPPFEKHFHYCNYGEFIANSNEL